MTALCGMGGVFRIIPTDSGKSTTPAALSAPTRAGSRRCCARRCDRIIDQFPAELRNQVRAMLSESLKGVVGQHAKAYAAEKTKWGPALAGPKR
jgi:hypothetical protein